MVFAAFFGVVDVVITLFVVIAVIVVGGASPPPAPRPAARASRRRLVLKMADALGHFVFILVHLGDLLNLRQCVEQALAPPCAFKHMVAQC